MIDVYSQGDLAGVIGGRVEEGRSRDLGRNQTKTVGVGVSMQVGGCYKIRDWRCGA